MWRGLGSHTCESNRQTLIEKERCGDAEPDDEPIEGVPRRAIVLAVAGILLGVVVLAFLLSHQG